MTEIIQIGLPDMKRLLIAICWIITISVHGQVSKGQATPKALPHAQTKKANVIDSVVTDKTKSIKQRAKQETTQLKTSAKQLPTKLKPDTLSKPDLKKTTKTAEKILEKKATNLQYDSDNPDDAPWKKKQFSKEDLNELDLKQPGVPSINGDKAKEYKDKIEKLKPSTSDEKKMKDEVSKAAKSEDLEKTKQAADKIENMKSTPLDEKTLKNEISKADKSHKLDKALHVADSLIAMKDRLEASSLQQEFLNAKKVYSEKYIKKICDSLGIAEGEKLFKMASALAKTETPKEELLKKINDPLKEKAGKEGISFDEKTQSLKMADAEKLNGLISKTQDLRPNFQDLASLKLPQDVLSELTPLTGKLMDSKYMPLIDSMREIAMKAKGYSLNEEQITEELKKTALKKKPSFMDKSYLEGILSFVNDSTISIVQIAPAWAYHFTDRISAGLGPNLSIQYQQKKINAIVGFRSFVKAEFWKQRVYAQIEDNFSPMKINIEQVRRTPHSILLGGGGILPLSSKLGINVSLFYRVNQKDVRPGGSPWVFRIGLSSMKKTGQK